MTKLKLGPIADEKPVRITAELPAATFRDLVAYAEALKCETKQDIEPAKLIAPMLARFMAADRGFTKSLRARSRTFAMPQEDLSSAREPSSKIA